MPNSWRIDGVDDLILHHCLVCAAEAWSEGTRSMTWMASEKRSTRLRMASSSGCDVALLAVAVDVEVVVFLRL